MKKKLLDITRDTIRRKHYSMKTEKSYIGWIKHYIFFHHKRHPAEMGKTEIEQFLTHLAVDRKVSSTTQNQAFYALMFLYAEVLGIDMKSQNIQALRAKERKHIPVVLTKDEVQKIISHLEGVYELMVSLMYGCGLRMQELLNLRIKDVDFGFDKVYIYDSKSLKDRTIPLPLKLKAQLQRQVDKVVQLHRSDVEKGFGSVYMPHAFEKKFPKGKYETKWQYLFPMRSLSQDPRGGETRRHHIHSQALGRNIKVAARKADIHKRVTSHIFRHTPAAGRDRPALHPGAAGA